MLPQVFLWIVPGPLLYLSQIWNILYRDHVAQVRVLFFNELALGTDASPEVNKQTNIFRSNHVLNYD